MTRDTHLTRRRMLAGLGGIGASAAVAGAGTDAYLSDEETFKDDRLVAGEFDLRMDWAEFYFAGGGATLEAAPSLRPVTGIEEVETGEVPLPTPVAPVAAVDRTDTYDLLAAIERERYPQSPVEAPCGEDGLLNVPRDLRQEGGRPRPVIDLADCKPGDFGTTTFSLHPCGPNGYLWLQGQLRSAEEGGVTDPEAADPDEESGLVELLDAVQTVVWYDQGCNGVLRRSQFTGTLDEPLVVGGPTSLRTLLEALSTGRGLPLDGAPNGTADQPAEFQELADPPTSERRECFLAGDGPYCVGVAYHLPLDHQNEVQTDAATFDLGFYAEQCAANDGAGMPPETTDGTGE